MFSQQVEAPAGVYDNLQGAELLSSNVAVAPEGATEAGEEEEEVKGSLEGAEDSTGARSHRPRLWFHGAGPSMDWRTKASNCSGQIQDQSHRRYANWRCVRKSEAFSIANLGMAQRLSTEDRKRMGRNRTIARK